MSNTVLPEVNFIETNSREITEGIISGYESLTKRSLAEADPVRLFLLSIANVVVQQSVAINDSARQNLLRYSRDGVLDHKGYAWNTPRLGNEPATTVIRFYISEIMGVAKIIPRNTVVTADGDLLFKTFEEGVIQPWANFVDVRASCETPGKVGNGYEVGEIDTMLHPLVYIQRVENVTVSAGGTEEEGNDVYRARIQQSPEKLSTAGPDGAYEYFARSASAAIADVYVGSPEPGYVDVKVLMEDGELPSEEIIEVVLKMLSDRKVRPLTDNVTVGAPTVVEYDLEFRYYIDRSAADKTLIQQNIEQAVQDYILWQKSKIGRDINPSKLISDCVRAGAKRVEVISPAFTVVLKGHVAHEASVDIAFGGDEDD
ncbi:baseplate assembly protein [Sporosarcina sp. FSL K6-5500]|uniref:baseplate assembly protein n=1 Tax=Sporosarcina sp. FSL K6-5500 TaxID=2921558 RepID=UPI0030F97368